MSGRSSVVLVLAVFVALFASERMTLADGMGHHAAASNWDVKSAQRFSQAAIGREVRPAIFRNRQGRVVRLADYRGKPVIVNLIYTTCTHTCPLIVEALYRSVIVARDVLGGKKFAVLTIGFDTRTDTPARMRAYAIARNVQLDNWRFLSADRTTIKRLADDLGFMFRPAAGGFEHLSQTTIIDSSGKVYRQVYGGDFRPPAVVEPLKELIYGRRGKLASVSGIVNRIRLFCTVYSSSTGRYRFDYGIFVALIVGVMSLGSIGFVLVRAGLRAFSGRHPA